MTKIEEIKQRLDAATKDQQWPDAMRAMNVLTSAAKEDIRFLLDTIASKLSEAQKGYELEFTAVLWSRLCGKGAKVTKHDTLNRAIKYVASIATGIPICIHNGEIQFCEGDDLLATITVKIKEDA